MFHVPNQFRYNRPNSRFNSDPAVDKNNGFFIIPGPYGRELVVIGSDGMGWEHVSVSLEKHIPSWDEMNFVKGLFWDETDTVIQFHPPKKVYVNNHPRTLHLWRKIGNVFELPDALLVGLTDVEIKKLKVGKVND